MQDEPKCKWTRKAVLLQDGSVLGNSLETELRELGCDVVPVPSAELILAMWARQSVELIVVGLWRSGREALSELERLRDAGVRTPVVAVLGEHTEIRRAQVLRSGADDCVPAGSRKDELAAALDAVVRRRAWDTTLFCVDGRLALDRASHTAAWRDGSVERRVKLTPAEFDLVCLLAENEGQTVAYSKIDRRIWGRDMRGDGDQRRAGSRRMRSASCGSWV